MSKQTYPCPKQLNRSNVVIQSSLLLIFEGTQVDLLLDQIHVYVRLRDKLEAYHELVLELSDAVGELECEFLLIELALGRGNHDLVSSVLQHRHERVMRVLSKASPDLIDGSLDLIFRRLPNT